MAKELNKYSFIGSPNSLLQQVANVLVNDPNWRTIKNTQSHNNWGRNQDNLFLISKLKPDELFFTLTMNRWNYDYYLYYGLKPVANPTATSGLNADVYVQKGWTYGTPFSTGTTHYNAQYLFTVFTNEDYVYIHGELQNYQGTCFPFRLWMGRLTPHTIEDPAIAKDFVGIFPMIPMGVSDTDYAWHGRRMTGEGVVRKSLNGTEYTDYHFSTMSEMTSPGAGDIFHISPFYVWANNEGVRGEFTGIRTAVLKNPAEYPNDTILDLGTDKYRIFYVNGAPVTSNTSYYMDSNNSRTAFPRFFPSEAVFAGGQRVLLFKI